MTECGPGCVSSAETTSSLVEQSASSTVAKTGQNQRAWRRATMPQYRRLQRGEELRGAAQPGLPLEGIGKAEQPRFAPGLSKEGQSDRQPVHHARRDGDVGIPGHRGGRRAAAGIAVAVHEV